MKTSNKRELQQIAFNHSSDIEFRIFINLCKNCTAKLCSFLVIDTTVTSIFFFHASEKSFRKNIKVNHDK